MFYFYCESDSLKTAILLTTVQQLRFIVSSSTIYKQY